MAIVKGFAPAAGKTVKPQPTEVECYWATLREGPRTMLIQLDTRGSGERAKPNKQSQTLQFDRDSARALVEIMKREFDL